MLELTTRLDKNKKECGEKRVNDSLESLEYKTFIVNIITSVIAHELISIVLQDYIFIQVRCANENWINKILGRFRHHRVYWSFVDVFPNAQLGMKKKRRKIKSIRNKSQALYIWAKSFISSSSSRREICCRQRLNNINHRFGISFFFSRETSPSYSNDSTLEEF